MKRKEALEIAIYHVQNAIGDDYIRAKNAFARCTPEQMQEQYGMSGKTRQEILDGYKKHDDKMHAVIDVLNSI